jgi:hypothetical protein
MPTYSVTGPDRISFGIISADTPLDALCGIHADAFGPGRVRVDGDRLVFSSPDEQRLCAGIWRVVPLQQNGKRGGVEVTIPAP